MTDLKNSAGTSLSRNNVLGARDHPQTLLTTIPAGTTFTEEIFPMKTVDKCQFQYLLFTLIMLGWQQRSDADMLKPHKQHIKP